MKTYSEFLTEKFLKGYKGRFDYTDVYINPARSELLYVGHQVPAPLGTEAYGRPCLHMGGILTKTKLIVFNRESAEHQGIVSDIRTTQMLGMPDLGREWIPVYLHYFPPTQTVDISFASYSAHHLRGNEPSTEELVSMARSHPAFKIFKKIVGAGVR